jgi:DNA-binding GntR family transcriptional regulator
MTRNELSRPTRRDARLRLGATKLAALARPETLAESAYERVAQSLMDGAYIPGDRVASRSVAADLGISATPAREAILRLVGEGALELVNARIVAVPQLTPARLKEIYALRFALEPMAAAEAAKNLTNDDFRRLDRAQERMKGGYGRLDYRTVFTANREFHFCIYAASRMPLVVSFIRATWLRIGPTFRLLYPSLAIPADAVRIHEVAMAAARTRDGDGLSGAIRRDLARGEALLTRVISGTYADAPQGPA